MIRFVFIFFLFCDLTYGQTFRVYYNLTYKPNKTDTIRKTRMDILIFNKTRSSFQPYEIMHNDSLFAINREQGSVSDQGSIIINNLETMESTLKKIMVEQYEYTEPAKLNWKLNPTNEMQSILNVACQKATVEYGGRKWVAWFSTEYPFAFGPYKFFGLSGLILKMEDTDKDYVWIAKGIEKQNNTDLYDKTYYEIQGLHNIIKLPKKEFLKAEVQYKLHPMAGVMKMIPNLTAKDIKEIQDNEKKMIKKNSYYNNSIEIH